MIKGSEEYDVVVVGGGISGLKAALELAKKGRTVKLLEAKERLGGRIFTAVAADGKTPVELGASYWEGTDDNEMYQSYFAKGYGIAGKPEVTKFLDKMEQCDFLTLDEDFAVSEDRIGTLLFTAMDLDLESSPTYKNRQALIDNLPFKELGIDTSEIPLFKRIAGMLSAEMSTQPSDVGTLLVEVQRGDPLQKTEKYNSEEARTTVVKNGYSQLIDQIAAECIKAGVIIETNTPVTKIIQNEQCVTIEKKDGIKVTAKQCVCAVPEGILKSQPELFEPPLPADKSTALEHLGIHDACRIVLEFEAPLNKEAPYIFLDKPNENKTYYFRNFYLVNGYPMIHSDDYGILANKLYKGIDLNDKRALEIANEKLISIVMDDLRAAMVAQGKKMPKLKSFKVHNWSADPYAKGAYSYRSPQMTMSDQVALEQHNGSVHFAGAYTSRYSESVHNAYASGIRASISVEQALTSTPKKRI